MKNNFSRAFFVLLISFSSIPSLLAAKDKIIAKKNLLESDAPWISIDCNAIFTQPRRVQNRFATVIQLTEEFEKNVPQLFVTYLGKKSDRQAVDLAVMLKGRVKKDQTLEFKFRPSLLSTGERKKSVSETLAELNFKLQGERGEVSYNENLESGGTFSCDLAFSRTEPKHSK